MTLILGVLTAAALFVIAAALPFDERRGGCSSCALFDRCDFVRRGELDHCDRLESSHVSD